MKKSVLLLILLSSTSYASSWKKEITAYAFEGLSHICSQSRELNYNQRSEMRTIYINKKLERKREYPANKDYAYYASKQIWDFGEGDSASYSECAAILKK
ncbi:hypothetical protein INR79_25675 [Vibrio sp. SCSIO 43132]|uniref:hypothetical protein n=1 Tax=Vibrio sp. SCSIO 43132 TaxID=2779363 RepID=UPI001CA923D9|nr:hypothetical protein [Vibrio sp. SCSIO 43132]UAB72651.1 hypothetical protein INR79_25675 [Vibrio sp. SCSIO 43132]